MLPVKQKGGLVYGIQNYARQRAKIKTLVHKTCCNCYKENCLLLDDGEETKCVQLISRHGIYCNCFLKAVLPAEKELYTEILWQNGING